MEKVINTYQLYLEGFTLEKFRDQIQDEDCRNCLFEFSKQVVAYLKKFNFLVFSADGKIAATQLGKAAFASSIPPEHSLKIFTDLAESRGQLVLETDLHLLYLITPHFKQLREPNWEVFISKYRKLSKAERNVADQYGINIEYLYKTTVYPPRLPKCLLDPTLVVNTPKDAASKPSRISSISGGEN